MKKTKKTKKPLKKKSGKKLMMNEPLIQKAIKNGLIKVQRKVSAYYPDEGKTVTQTFNQDGKLIKEIITYNKDIKEPK